MQDLAIKILLSILLLTGNFSGIKAQKDKAIQTFGTDSQIILDICLDASGKSLAVADGNLIKIFDLESQKLLRTLENGHTEKIISITISSDNHYLLSADIEQQLVLWDFEKGILLQKLDYHTDLIHDIEISLDNRYILSGGMSDKVLVYDLEQKKVVKEIQDHKNKINTVAFSPDSSLMATAGTDKKIRIYSLPNFELLGSPKEHTSGIRDISFNKESKRLVSTGDDSRVLIWNLNDLQNIRLLRKSTHGSRWVLSVDFSSEDKISFSSAGLDGRVRIYSTFGQFSWNAEVPIHKVLFKPQDNAVVKVILATRGKGVLMVNLSKVATRAE